MSAGSSEEKEEKEEKEAIKARALALGFVRVGFATAGRLEPEGQQLAAFVEEGRHGDMAWLADTVAVRSDPRHPGMLPSTQSVIVLVAPYARPADPNEAVGPSPGRVARYARGRDYHNLLTRRVRKLERWLRERGHEARASVDSRPVFERAWAQRAGVGFIGKNCCLIVPGMGSHVFLSCVVTSAVFAPDAPMKERCGSCTLCLDACPTDAFQQPRKLDARKCISYLTIEQRGPIAVELRASMKDWLFGCDACQDICPYNRTSPEPPETTLPFASHPRWASTTASDLLSMDATTFASWAQGSPVRRTGLNGLARNAAIVLGNQGKRVHLPVLQATAENHPDATVRDAAAWAVHAIHNIAVHE